MSGDAPGGADRRRRFLLGGLALLVVLGLALGAAGLDEVRLSSAGGTGGYDAEEPIQVGDTQRAAHPDEAGTEATVSPYYVFGFFVLMAMATVLVAWRRDVITAWSAVAVMVVVFLFVATLMTMAGSPFEPTNGSANLSEPPDRSALGSGSGDQPNTAPPATALPTGMLVFVGLLLGLSAILGFSRRGGDESSPPEEEDADEATVAEVGAAAGRAADRLEGDADLENPIYEAWHDMTAALDEPGEPTETPTEFRDRAIAAGLPPGPVAELTTVFRDVRYGHEAATAERVEVATAALRDVEDAAAALTESGPEAPDEDPHGPEGEA